MNLIKIILPCYNAEKYIDETLISIENQTFKNFDLYIIDDCSNDNTINIIENFIDKTNISVKLIKNRKNFGVSYSRNRALIDNQHEYIAFIDADDVWHKDKLQKQYSKLEKSRRENSNISFISTNVSVIFDEHMRLELVNNKLNIKNPNDLEEYFNSFNPIKFNINELLDYGNKIVISSVLIHKSAISFAENFDQTLTVQIEDYLLWCKISLNYEAISINEKLTFYRIHKGSYTNQHFLSKTNQLSSSLVRNLIEDRLRIFCKNKNLNSNLEINKINNKSRLYRIFNYLRYLTVKSNFNYFENIGFNNTNNNSSLILEEVIIHVTDTCDLRCTHCFIDEFSSNHLSFQNFKKVLKSIGNVQHILLTGGEPFFNKEIEDIALYALQYYSIQINTNGFLTEKIISHIKNILRHDFKNRVKINISLDGLQNFHDIIRQRENSFQRATDTMRLIHELSLSDPRIHLNVNTTLTDKNFDEVIELIELIGNKFNVSYHNIEIVRGSDDADSFFRQNKKLLVSKYKTILQKIKNFYPSEYETTKFRYKKQLDFVLNNKKWGYACLAGQNNVVVFAKGEIAACENRKKILHLDDHNYDINSALKDKRFKTETSDIIDNECCCQHGCWLQTSHSPKIRKKYFFTNEQTALKYQYFWDFLINFKLIYIYLVTHNVFSKVYKILKNKN